MPLVIFLGMAALCIVGSGLLLLYGLRARSGAYYYDIKADSHYDFSRAGALAVQAEIRAGRMTIAAKMQPGCTLFAALKIRATDLGRWFEPRLEISDGRHHLGQAFERGCAGLRYINLSSLSCDGATALRLDGKFLTVADQSVTLYYGPAELLDAARGPVLVISPHPDDAEIAAFGLYANRDAYVLTITAGEGGELSELGSFAGFGGSTAYAEKGRTRVWNSLTVPMLGGLSAERAANLGYFDGTLSAMQRQPALPVNSLHTDAQSLDAFGQEGSAHWLLPRAGRRATWTNLVEDLAHVIQQLDPQHIVTPYPRLDAHPDHKLCTAALLEAIRELSWDRGSLLLYVNHSVASAGYPYGPAGDVVSLPPGGSGVVFDALLSQPLSHAQQQRKRVALDAMNDLRRFPPTSLTGVLWQSLQALKAAFTANDQSYFRRAVRSNELFFKVRATSLQEPGIIQAILGTFEA